MSAAAPPPDAPLVIRQRGFTPQWRSGGVRRPLGGPPSGAVPCRGLPRGLPRPSRRRSAIGNRIRIAIGSRIGYGRRSPRAAHRLSSQDSLLPLGCLSTPPIRVPPVHAELRLGQDQRCSRKRVEGLKRQAGVAGIHRRRRGGRTRRDFSADVNYDLAAASSTPRPHNGGSWTPPNTPPVPGRRTLRSAPPTTRPPPSQEVAGSSPSLDWSRAVPNERRVREPPVDR